MDLIWVRYSDPDPEVATEVVNSTAVAYQEHRASSFRGAASRRREVVASQLSGLSDSLRAAERLVLDYQAQERLLNPEVEGGALLASVTAAENELRRLRYSEGLLSTLVAGLRSVDRRDESLQQIMALGADMIPAGPALSRQLQEYDIQRSQLTASRFGRTAADPQVEAIDSLIALTKIQLRSAAEESYNFVVSQRRDAESRLGQLTREVGDLPGRTAEYARLQQRVNAIQNAFDRLVDEYFEAQIAEGVEAGDIEIAALASVPVRPDPERVMLIQLLALVMGLLIGSVGALLWDQFDSSVRAIGDVERATSLQVIATIPDVKSGTVPSMQIGREAFRTLRTHLRFAPISQPKLLAVTSATPRDGKTTVAGNLALTYAEQGLRTILVDCDIRRPQVQMTFNLNPSPGLSDVLLKTCDIDQAIQVPDLHPSLAVMTTGTPHVSATELIGGADFAALMNELRQRYDAVVIDTPPVLAVSDAALVGALADGTIVVATANKTDQQDLENAVAQLRRLNVPMLGIVLNRVSIRKAGYSYYPAYDSEGDVGERKDTTRRPLLKKGHATTPVE